MVRDDVVELRAMRTRSSVTACSATRSRSVASSAVRVSRAQRSRADAHARSPKYQAPPK
nr:hypothetical protein [Clavibacter michiganensis]